MLKQRACLLALLLTLFALSPQRAQGQTTVTTTTSGNWSDPTIWSSQALPTTGEAVTIAPSHTVAYDVSSDAVLGQINVQGTLSFSRHANTRLRLGHSLIVHPGATLDMGTMTDSIPSHVQTELTFVLTQAQSNAYNNDDVHDVASAQATPNIGLFVYGRWDSHGSKVVRTWSKLDETTNAGSRRVIVANDVTDWPLGGLVVATSTALGNQNEVRTIAGMQALPDSRTLLTFTVPLAFTHLGEAVKRGEIGLLTRNVKISTEIVGLTAFASVTSRKFAHTVYMPGARGDLYYTEFARLGHISRLARYPIHYHRMRASSVGMIAKGNSIYLGGFRCLNLHVSHGVLVADNVCYDVAAHGYFNEDDAVLGFNQDNVYLHNLGVYMRPRASSDLRVGAFWPRNQTRHEAHLGNVAVGGGEIGDGNGFGFGEEGNSLGSGGTIPFTFVHNEAHSLTSHGVFTWQNMAHQADIVDTLVWSVGKNCIRWGAYRTLLRYYNTQCLDFATHAVNITSVAPYMQDGVMAGGPYGINLSGYVLEQYPADGATFMRILFRDITVAAIWQKQQQFANDNAQGNECGTQTPGTPSALQQRAVWPGNCSGNFVNLLGNRYENVNRPLRFGKTANPNSYWMDGQNLYVRADLQEAGKCGVITCKLLSGETLYDSASDALKTPLNSLPPSFDFDLLNARPSNQQDRSRNADYTLSTIPDYPPVVSLDVTFSGPVAQMTATAADDGAAPNGFPKVEFLLNWQVVGVDSEPPYEAEVDLTGYSLDYAYLYARAIDDAGQRAYSQTLEIGPELLAVICAREG